MGYCCNLSPSSHLHANGLSQRINYANPDSLRKGKQYAFRRISKVVAYYGLKTPPYKFDALEPYMSKRTIEMHWGEHHRGYLEALNIHLGKDDILYGYTMDELVKVTYNNGNPLPQFNDAAQVWNHDFFWESMEPGGEDSPKLGLLHQIEKDFCSFASFKEKFIEAAVTLFGSGYIWLVCGNGNLEKQLYHCVGFFLQHVLLSPMLIVKRNERRLAVVKTSNAVTPIVWDDIPILCLDMWEHAYYLDYKNDKAKYATTFMNHLVSWHSATARLARAQAFVNLGEPKIPVA